MTPLLIGLLISVAPGAVPATGLPVAFAPGAGPHASRRSCDGRHPRPPVPEKRSARL